MKDESFSSGVVVQAEGKYLLPLLKYGM